MPASTATLADIARRAGVSINTVSRAFRAPHTVRPALRRQIEAVAEELSYVPNRLAGGLAGGSTSVVGVVITSLFYSEFAETIDAMQAELTAAGLSVMLGNSHYDPDEEWQIVRTMMSWRPVAIALVGVDHHPAVDELLRRSDVPVVEIWDQDPAPIDSVVGMDHEAIGRMQVRHLLEHGYRRIAFLGAVRTHDARARKRAAGYAAELRAATGSEPVLVTEAIGGNPDLGEGLAMRLLDAHPATDAIVSNSDAMAFGILRCLRRLGRFVPGEVGVIGFGDNEASSCTIPSLTSIRPPRADIGRAAGRAILARIAGGTPERRVFDAALVARQSTARG